MASKYWIKLYHEILDDPKMGRLTDRLFKRTIQLFLLAGEYEMDGILPIVEDIAWRLRVHQEELETDLADLASVGIVQKTNDRWVVTKFADRQKASTGTERWQQWQERQRKKDYYQTEVQRKPNVSLSDKDIDIDVDIDKRIDIDGEEPNANGIYADLSVTFCNKTGIPELSGGPSKWYDSLKRMGEAGVKSVDIENAITILREKKYPIVTLRSVENTAIGEMSKRVSSKGGKAKDPGRYVTGELSDYIEY